ncbi:MAG: hypothetical protein COA90_11645 [Gammaproteobacteria bacterium]|nr:MAG: hypothetical protein COA90_11645 [Gammaproteobacteria bacterium]
MTQINTLLYQSLCSGSLNQELDTNRDVHNSRLSKDEIKDEIANLFINRVTEPYTEEILSEIIKEGESRYEDKTPPGYMDISKGNTSGSVKGTIRKFGVMETDNWPC